MSTSRTFPTSASLVTSFVGLVLIACRMALFFTMRVLRGPVRFVLGLAAALALCSFVTMILLSWYNHWSLSMLGVAAVLFGVTVAMNGLTWYYDVLLLKLTPPGYQIFLVN